MKKIISTSVLKPYFRWPTWLTFTVVYLVFLATSLVMLDPDFGWHVAAGTYFTQHGIPPHDIFTYTAPNFPWVDHEWLSDIIVAFIHNHLGYEVLCVLFAGMWTLALWLVGRRVYSPLLLLAALSLVPLAGVRSITWSVLLLAILVAILASKHRKVRLLIPLLFLVWANLHGSFLAGFLYGGLIMLRERSWKLLILGVVALLATFINPYGVHIYTEIFRTLLDSELHGQITEWASFVIRPLSAAFFLIWGVGVVFQLQQRKWREALGIDTIFLLSALMSMRMWVLFVIVSLVPTYHRLRAIVTLLPGKLNTSRYRLVSGLLAFFAVLTIGLGVYEYQGISFDRERKMPRQSVAYLKAHPCTGNLFNDYNFGGYLIGELPGTKVYIDGRMPSWERGDTKYFNIYEDIRDVDGVREREFSRYNIRCAIVHNDRSDPLVKELQKEGWRVVVDEPTALLLVRESS